MRCSGTATIVQIREENTLTKILGPIGVAMFEDRGINSETAARLEIYTAKAGIDGSIIPHAKGDIVVFPFIERGNVVNEKYRGPGKKFWQMKGASARSGIAM